MALYRWKSRLVTILLFLAVMFLVFFAVSGETRSEQPSEVMLFGYKLLRVESGSMEPEILTGALILAKKAVPARISAGDIITFRRGGERETCTHRVTRVELSEGIELQFYTMGDALGTEDPQPVLAQDVLYQKVYIGNWFARLRRSVQTPDGKISVWRAAVKLLLPLSCLLGLLFLLADLLKRRRGKRRAEFEVLENKLQRWQWHHESRETLLEDAAQADFSETEFRDIDWSALDADFYRNTDKGEEAVSAQESTGRGKEEV